MLVQLLLAGALALAGCSRAPAEQPAPPPAIVPLRPGVPTPAGGPVVPSVDRAPVGSAQAGLPGRLLFARGGNLWLWQADTVRQITGSGDAFQPAWSPDGERIAFVRRVQSYSDVLIMPVAAAVRSSSDALQLTTDGPDGSVYSYERVYASMWAFYPAWSPDGTTIAYASQGGPPFGSPMGEYNMSIFTVGAGGGRRAQLYADNAAHIGRLAYAPDGASIVFAREPTGEGAPALYRYTPASGVAAPLAGAPEQSYDPAFSPDSRWVAFAARVEHGTDVFALPASGGQPIRLTTHGLARAPAFSPDGKLLAFLAIPPGANSFDLWVVDVHAGPAGALQAGPPRQITRDMKIDADSGLSWAR